MMELDLWLCLYLISFFLSLVSVIELVFRERDTGIRQTLLDYVGLAFIVFIPGLNLVPIFILRVLKYRERYT